MGKELIAILNRGGNTRLIAETVRNLGVYCEVFNDVPASGDLKGIVVAGPCADKFDVPIMCIESGMEFESALNHFVKNTCKCSETWSIGAFIEQSVAEIKQKVGKRRVLLAPSGGDDSSVCALLGNKAVGKQLTCIFVDHGLLRKNEREQVEKLFLQKFDINLVVVDAKQRFYERLSGVADPEEKRRVIGETFIRVFEEEAQKHGKIEYLVQGTIYPDVIESDKGAVIKSHHNVGGLPEQTSFRGYIEPLRSLFKEEVRNCGRELGLPDAIVTRQPFPGPGLGVRIIGEVTPQKVRILQEADAIFREEMEKASCVASQYFAVLTDSRSVGVSDGQRTFDSIVALRAIKTTDFMQAKFVQIPYDLLAKVSERITREVKGVGRVVYDITNKPPSTIEWE